MSQPEFDLHALVRDAVESESFESPQVTAERLVEEIPAEALREVVKQVLPEYVRRVVGELRRTATAPTRSKKANRAQDILTVHVVVGDQWKRLGDCTLTDLTIIVQQHQNIAKFNVAEAEKYKRLAKKMHDANCAHVSGLGLEAVMEAFDA